MNAFFQLAFLCCVATCFQDVVAFKCILCAEFTLNGVADADAISCGSDAEALECPVEAEGCYTACSRITGKKDGADVDLVVKLSECNNVTSDAPDEDCGDVADTDPEVVADMGWTDVEFKYSRTCSCTGEECNREQVNTCGEDDDGDDDSCVNGQACENDGECKTKVDGSLYCQCPYTYTGDTCGSRFTTGESCVRDCEGKTAGSYQSCLDCSSYVNCIGSAGEPTTINCEPTTLQWDDTEKACQSNTNTCELKEEDISAAATTAIAAAAWILVVMAIFYRD